jgi:predicted Ser/Thr protein kinase
VFVAPGIIELGDDAGLEVLGELGRGDQAIVYRARRGGRYYAVKVLRRDRYVAKQGGRNRVVAHQP